MEQLQRLIGHVIDRANLHLKEPFTDVGPYVRELIPLPSFTRQGAVYAFTGHHPARYVIRESNAAGSYFLGQCVVERSVLFQTDVRGDELKCKGDTVSCSGMKVPVQDHEVIHVRNSYLVNTLVHSNCHDPGSPEVFDIRDTIAMHYANIHGSPIRGSYLGPFATVDLTSVQDSVVGTFSYVQAGELYRERVEDGCVWVRAKDKFECRYTFDRDVLERYVRFKPGGEPGGIIGDFVAQRKSDIDARFDMAEGHPDVPVPERPSVSRFAVVKGNARIGSDVLVAQRAYVEDTVMGDGSNAQENCILVGANLEGRDVTAHGGKIVFARLGKNVFVGFNSFLRGSSDHPLTIGEHSIVMPHTIADLDEAVDIPPRHLVYGYIRNRADLAANTVSLDDLSRCDGELKRGNLVFRGKGAAFVHGFEHRIEHILEANGALFASGHGMGHAQKNANISHSVVRHITEGALQGLHPAMELQA
ncbi:glucosamine-1-phosphate N-acetyltransferase / UDP-N-acetylglucosamine pyrophosphorylase [Syntrophobacter fumaroxidans]|uniref:Putative glucosamine-1-phosphate N-acetyltransferase / UDP-N-acetylglucosamine pyrophosphorylase n=1 Tax=Syntrophobacter fumaroxidans (strain DSM 10017 / MPOB) TaxID=335543 RepID=A0LG05_SYNFM|nr:glucosamine-1-phosphate N-acetyltransferase / UDP-N-acetylglucosamine pyrophosphorylase [Syntrophobacter fumaroxidans]ABK16357.1 putative glucosamine-1-phosphate N-acetyltransferase / UDP-N-acetylglucosamine pyrophosphorylase [Syntrophobacter fumaroxidans MPOB]